MVILRGNDIAKKWRDETLQSPISFLFEQNAFNRTVWMNGGALVLDENEWNLNAEMAGNDQAPNSVAGARVLHSSGTPETMRTCNITLQTGGEKFTAPLRTFWRKDLMNLHIQYIHHLFAANPDSVANLGSAGQSP